MRVGIHADALGHALPGGIGVYVRRLVDELRRGAGGAEIRLLLSRGTEAPEGWPPETVRRSRLPLRVGYWSWNTFRRPRFAGLDIVHATAMVIPPARAVLVATIHDDTVERFPELVPAFWRRLYRRGLRLAIGRARVLCAVSEATKRRVVDRYGIDPDRVVVTPQAAGVAPGDPEDESIFTRLGIRTPYLLHVGTMEPRKNQPRLVEAFTRAGVETHQLVIAGAPGWGEGETRRAVRSSRAAPRIVLTGRVTDAELAALYRRADAFAYPSVYEGFGMPLLEALGYGLPSVASTDDALVEVGGDAVLAVDPGEVTGLAEAVAAVCADDDVRARLRSAAPARAARYSWGRTAEATRAAWRKAIA